MGWPSRLGNITSIPYQLAINHASASSTDRPTYPQFNIQWIGPVTYIFTIARSHTDWPSQSINHVAPSSTNRLTHLRSNVQWICRSCTYYSLLGLIPTGHSNLLTAPLRLVLTGRQISNSMFNGSAGNVHILHCSVSYQLAIPIH